MWQKEETNVQVAERTYISDLWHSDRRQMLKWDFVLALSLQHFVLTKPSKVWRAKRQKNTKQFHRVEKDQFQNYRDLFNQLKMTTSVNSRKHSFTIIHYRWLLPLIAKATTGHLQSYFTTKNTQSESHFTSHELGLSIVKHGFGKNILIINNYSINPWI